MTIVVSAGQWAICLLLCWSVLLIYFFLYFSTKFRQFIFFRVGGRENYFHCKKCGMHRFLLPVKIVAFDFFVWSEFHFVMMPHHTDIFLYMPLIRSVLHVYAVESGCCYVLSLRNNHSCVENSMRHHCPICYEVFTDSFFIFFLLYVTTQMIYNKFSIS